MGGVHTSTHLSNARNPRKPLAHKGNLSDASEGALPVSNPCFGVCIPFGTFGALRRLHSDESKGLNPLQYKGYMPIVALQMGLWI